MRNPTHLMHLKQRGIESWNRWRQDHPEIRPDLSAAYLCASSLAAINLSQAQLRQADLYSADLWGADLSGADVQAANLSSANLSSANLAQANFAEADLIGANLAQADLAGANLCRANLSMTNLAGANLSGANLTEANLKGARLTHTDLTKANLAGANLTGVMVTDWDLHLIATLQQTICEHIYVLSCLSMDAEDAALEGDMDSYTAYFRSTLHQFYQSFIEACDNANSQIYRIAWPSLAIANGPEIYLQSVDQQGNGDLLVRVGISQPATPLFGSSPVTVPVNSLDHDGRDEDYYRYQLCLKENQIATVQRQNNELLELLRAMSQRDVYVQSVSVLENSVMTGVSKYNLSGANIGNFADTVAAGGHQQSVQHNYQDMDTVTDWEVVVQVETLLNQLAAQSAQVPPHQRPQRVGQVIQKKATDNPDFKARLLKAIESGSGELVRVFTQNPYISVPMALVKGWVAAG